MSSRKTRKTKEIVNFPNRVFNGNTVIENLAETFGAFKPCLNNLYNILKDEHCPTNKIPFCNGELAINLDMYESQRAKLQKNSRNATADCIIGLQYNWLLLVEIKYEVKTIVMDTLSKNIREKREYSRNILNSYEGFHCEKKMIILLNDNNFEIKKTRLLRCLGNKVSDYKVMTISKFYEVYFNSDIMGN